MAGQKKCWLKVVVSGSWLCCESPLFIRKQFNLLFVLGVVFIIVNWLNKWESTEQISTSSSTHIFCFLVLRYLFNQHTEDGGRQPRLPETPREGSDQLQQEEESGGNHRRDPAVSEPALLSESGARDEGEHSPFQNCLWACLNCAQYLSSD